MKKIMIPSYLAVALSLQAAGVLPVKSGAEDFTPYTVAERGAHHRIWERTSYKTGPDGQPVSTVHRYTELGTGMHYMNAAGQWVESREEIQILPDGAGAVANQGQHQVKFPNDLYGRIELKMPEGKSLHSQVVGLGYRDTTSGKTVLISQTRRSVGQLASPNAIIYPDAFTDLQADMRYTYTKGGFEQDVILRQQPPSPGDYGLDPATTRLQVLTEFFSPPVPEKRVSTKNGMTDEQLIFGSMRIGRGKAFQLGSNSRNLTNTLPVGKQWMKLEGRDFLVEEVQYKQVKEKLESILPAWTTTKRGRGGDAALHRVVSGQAIPRSQVTGQSSTPIQMARANVDQQPGYVLDYVVLTSVNNYTFKGDTTYFVDEEVLLGGNLVFEGGAVIKYGAPGRLYIFDNSYTFATAPYRPVIFTGYNDPAVGEIVQPGALGWDYGDHNGALAFNDGGANIKNAQFRRLHNPFFVEYNSSFENVTFIECACVFTVASCQVVLNNCLFDNNTVILNEFSSGNPVDFRGTHVTVYNHGMHSWIINGPGNFYATNCLFNGIFTMAAGASTYYTNGCARFTNTAGFTKAGAGHVYLATNSPYRNAGAATIEPKLLASIRTKTTYPPAVLSNIVISTDMVFGPYALRDTDQPDIGYHYDPIDYLTMACVISNATLTVTNGATIGHGNTYAGIGLQTGSEIISRGTPSAPNWFVHYATAQEQAIVIGEGTFADTIVVNPFHSADPAPQGMFRSTKFATFSGGGLHLCHSNSPYHYSDLLVRDCEFFIGRNVFSGNTNSTAELKNNLFYRSGFLATNSIANSLSLSNNLFKNVSSAIKFATPHTNLWYAFNNSFDTCLLDPGCLASNGYNAYITSTNRIKPDFGTDLTPGSFTYDKGTLGDFYHNSTSLQNAGSTTADVADLFNYSTRTNSQPETNSIVDIGYHYWAPTFFPTNTYYIRQDAALGLNDGSDWNNAFTNVNDMTFERGAKYYMARSTDPDCGYGYPECHVTLVAESGTEPVTIIKATVANHGTEVGWENAYDDIAWFVTTLNIISDNWVIDGQTGMDKDGHGIRIYTAGAKAIDLTTLAQGPVTNITIKHVGAQAHSETNTLVTLRTNKPHESLVFLAGGCENITFQYCYFHLAFGALIKSHYVDSMNVEYCYLEKNANNNPLDLHSEAMADTGSGNVIIRYNKFTDIDGTGFIVGIGGATETVVDNWQIYGNVFWNTDEWGASVSATITTEHDGSNKITPTNWKIYNNTFYNIKGYFDVRSAGILMPSPYKDNITVTNNLWYQGRTDYSVVDKVDINIGSSGISGHDYNYFGLCVFPTTFTESANENSVAVGAPPNNLAAYSDAPGFPGFVNAAAGDFRLNGPISGYPGTAMPAPYNKDMRGVTRGNGGVWDIGAYDY